MSNKIFLATDHAGFEVKEFVKGKLVEAGFEVVDCGASEYDGEDDYPDFISKAVEALVQEPDARAIILGSTGQGEAMVANRAMGVRAAVYYGGSLDIITLSREHNDANTLSLGAGFLTKEEALQAVTLWLETPFSNEERHVRRIKKLDD